MAQKLAQEPVQLRPRCELRASSLSATLAAALRPLRQFSERFRRAGILDTVHRGGFSASRLRTAEGRARRFLSGARVLPGPRVCFGDGRAESSVRVPRFVSSAHGARLEGAARALLVTAPVPRAVLAQGKRRGPAVRDRPSARRVRVHGPSCGGPVTHPPETQPCAWPPLRRDVPVGGVEPPGSRAVQEHVDRVFSVPST